MTEKEKFVGKVITFKGARLAFARIHKAEQRKNKQGQPTGKAKFSCTILLDPSNKEHAATIAEIKAEAKRALDFRFGAGVWSPQLPNFFLPFGLGNDLPKLGKKIYDGFADMFYLKLADEKRPNLLNRSGGVVVEGDPECPYAGCYAAGTTTLYSYDNESRGAGANLRTLVYQGKGQAFGNGGANAEQDFAAIGDLGNEVPAGGAAADPFNI